jgi:hypothetical protein
VCALVYLEAYPVHLFLKIVDEICGVLWTYYEYTK